MSFIAELKRRNVVRVGIAYVVVAWLTMQVADIVFEAIGSPPWVMQTLLAVLAMGFLLALFFAWAFELTPEGVKREKDVDRSQSITPDTGKKLNNTIVVLLVLAVAYLLFDKFSVPAQPESGSFSQQTVEQAAITKEQIALTTIETEPGITRQSIAVLPFDNRSDQKTDEYFVDGIHDDLLTTIAKIGSMKVISRTSVMEYKDTTKKIGEIAEELGVANILEGGIQRSGSQVRINVQLIDADTDEHLWAEIYDRTITAENLFAIQSEISKAIAAALQTTLSPAEVQRINTRPTDNLAAYDAYLRGRQLMATRKAAELEEAAEAFNKAVELDPEFALAWVGVADSHYLLVGYGTLRLEEANIIRTDAIDRALNIDDQLGMAYASLGTLKDDQEQYEDAEIAFKTAIELSPNNATGWHWYSNFLSSFPLRTDERLMLAERATELDPKSSIIGSLLGAAYSVKGLFTLAESQYLKVIELDPDFAQSFRSVSGLYRFALGRYDKALDMARQSDNIDNGSMSSLLSQYIVYSELNDIASMRELLVRMTELDAEHATTAMATTLLSLSKGNQAGTRETIKWTLPKVKNTTFLTLLLAQFALTNQDIQLSRNIYLTATPGWSEPAQWDRLLARFPVDGCLVAWVFKQTGDEKLGSELLQNATRFHEELLPQAMEHAHVWSPEICYLAAGNTEKALLSLESQVADNHLDGWYTWHRIGVYDLIRHEPRYQALAEERERIVATQLEAIEAIKAGAEL